MQNIIQQLNFFFLTIIIVLFAAAPISNASTINAGDYEYSNDGGYIYEYNAKTKEKKILTSGYVVQISHKKDRLLYSNIVLDESGALAASSKAMGIYTYDLNARKDILLYSMKPDDDPVSILSWSPSDKYIALFIGGSMETALIIIDGTIGNKLMSATMYGTQCEWLNTDEFIFTEIQNNIHQDRSEIGGFPHGLTIYNLISNQKCILKSATETEDYYFEKLLNNNQILIGLGKIQTNETNRKERYKITYWIMDNNGNIIEEVKDYKP